MNPQGLFTIVSAFARRTIQSTKLSAAAFLSVSLLLTACGGGGGTENEDGADTYEFSPDTAVSGAAVDGPLLFADVAVYKLDLTASNLRSGAALATGTTNDQAQIVDLEISGEDLQDGPFLVEFTCDGGCIDFNTNAAPAIGTLRTTMTAQQLVSEDSEVNPAVYATSLSTLALELAHQAVMDDDTLTTVEALAQAQDIAKNIYGFGFINLGDDIDLFTTPPLPTAGADEQQSKDYFKAAELFTALLSGIKTADPSATADETLETLIVKLALDLSDGEIDGENDGDAIDVLDDIANFATVATTTPTTIPGRNDTQRSVSELEELFSEIAAEIAPEVTLELDILPVTSIQAPTPGLDTDGDGTIDKYDYCPEDPRGDSKQTCPVAFVISGSGELRAPEGSDYTFVNSDYTYTGSGTITGNIFYFQIVQETKPSTPGVAYLSVEGYFDLTTGLGESTLTECTGLELICDKVTPLPSTDSYSTGPLTDNNGNLIDSAEDLDGIEYFTWSQSSEIDPGYGGLASTTSEYKASVPTRADDDGDGVSNELDQCPNTPEGAVVDISTGCQLDDDGDRVFNEDDDCPDTIETIVDEHGCPRDTDGDDVFDDYDQCPNENFDVDADGCTLDTDRDLVRDAVPDRCPDTPLNTDVSAEGCPLDDLDGDGVLNTTPDVCPNTYLAPELVGPDGCALTDPDNDNVENDGTDLCPSTPSVAAANVDADGCALVLNIVGQQDDASIPTVGGLDPNAYTVYYLEGEPVDDGVTTPHSTASVPTAPSFTGTYNPETDAYTLNVDNYTIVVNVPLFPTWIKNPVTNITHVSDGSTGTVASKNDLIANATGVISITSTAVNCSVPGSPPPVTTGFCAAPAIAPYTVLTDLSWDGTTGNITTIINLGTQGGLQTITYTFTEAP